MNKKRRESLSNIISQLDTVYNSIQNVIFEEDDSRGNIPESFEVSSVYEESENASDEMNSALDLISEAKECLENAKCS